MNEYIQLPANIDSIDQLEEGRIKRFLTECEEISNTKYSLENLRSFYLKDKNECIKLIDESALRGFYFHTEKPNNLLPSTTVSLLPYIWAPEDQDRYKQLDFQKLGITGFIQRFNVKSDTFFHRIPLEGFTLINRHLSRTDLEQELIKSGFAVVHKAEDQIKEAGEEPVQGETQDNEQAENTEENIPAVGKNHSSAASFLINTDKRNELSQVKITDIFPEGKCWRFQAYCNRTGIKYVTDLTREQIEVYKKRKDVGNAEINQIQHHLKDLIYEDESLSSDTKIEQSSTSRSSKDSIVEVFSENIFRTFREFCKKNKLRTIDEITDDLIEEYSFIPGVGVSKVNLVKQKIMDNLNKSQESQIDDSSEQKTLVSGNSTMLIEDVFAENYFRAFRKYCIQHKLSRINEINAAHLEEFKQMRGVGVQKVEAVKQLIESTSDQNLEPTAFRPIAVSLEINDLFADSKYNMFKRFCVKHNIRTIDQLQAKHLESFKDYYMVGNKKVDEVKKVLNHYSEPELPTVFLFEAGKIYEGIKNKAVTEILREYGYEINTQSELKIEDIEGVDLNTLKDVFEPHLLMNLSNNLRSQQTPKEIVSKIKAILSEREFGIIIERYGQEKTLEEVGGDVGVTRERVRQIAKKAVRKIIGHLAKHRFNTIVRIVAKTDSFVRRQELIEIIGAENEYLVNVLKQGELSLIYYKWLDSFFFEKKGKFDFNKLENFIVELPDVFNFYEQQQPLEELLEDIGIENPSLELFYHLFQSAGFTKYGEYYSRGKLAISEVLSYLFKYNIQKPFRLDEEHLPYLQSLAKHHFDFELGDSVRSIDARMRDAENILLVDHATFQYFDSESFDTAIIAEIEDYLKKELMKKDTVNTEDVFLKYEERLAKLGINNKLHLYSIIRYFLDEQFAIGKGNTLNIFSNEGTKLSVEERIISFMKKHGGLCSKDQLLEVVKPMYKVDITIGSSDQIIPWGSKQAILVENLQLQKAEKDQLREFFNQSLQKGYATINALFNEMMFDRKLAALLRKKGIDEAAKLGGIVRILIPNLKGYTNFIYIEGSELDSFEKVLISNFTGETSREEMRTFIFDAGYKEMMASTLIKRLIEQGIFVEIDVDILYPSSLLEIDEASLTEIKQYVDEQMGDQDYLSLSNLKGYRRHLPSIELRWNPYLLKSVLERCHYRQVKKVYDDFRYDKVIVVKEDSPIVTFEDLIITILEKEYDGNMHEYAIYDFLMKKGILREQEYVYKKILPYEIKNSEKLIFDELGNAMLRQGS